MTPSDVLFADMLNKLAASTATLNKTAGSENLVKLVTSAFSPSKTLVLADLTLATFAGSDPLEATAGAQNVGYDPVVGEWFIEILSPAGGWYWEATGDTDPAETIRGYVLTDNAGTGLLGSGLLASPVIIQSESSSVQIPTVRLYASDLLAS